MGKDLAVRRATVTPFWWGLWTLFRYRTLKNYCKWVLEGKEGSMWGQ